MNAGEDPEVYTLYLYRYQFAGSDLKPLHNLVLKRAYAINATSCNCAFHLANRISFLASSVVFNPKRGH
jgi:hypothetical protein